MDSNSWIGRKVAVHLADSTGDFWYVGTVVDADDLGLTIDDASVRSADWPDYAVGRSFVAWTTIGRLTAVAR